MPDTEFDNEETLVYARTPQGKVLEAIRTKGEDGRLIYNLTSWEDVFSGNVKPWELTWSEEVPEEEA